MREIQNISWTFWHTHTHTHTHTDQLLSDMKINSSWENQLQWTATMLHKCTCNSLPYSSCCCCCCCCCCNNQQKWLKRGTTVDLSQTRQRSAVIHMLLRRSFCLEEPWPDEVFGHGRQYRDQVCDSHLYPCNKPTTRTCHNAILNCSNIQVVLFTSLATLAGC